MDIIISNSLETPLYEQIKDQIKNQILSGELPLGSPLPSMRVLAKDLHLSVITTKRAYEDLEREGFIESVVGKGSFVKSVNYELVKESIRYEIEELFETALKKAELAKLPANELMEMLELLISENNNNKAI